MSAAHGVRGWLRVQVFGDGGDVLEPGLALHVAPPTGEPRVYALRRCTSGRRAGEARLALEGVDDREAAEALCGSTLSVAAALLGDAGEDAVWVHELVGCRVESEQGEVLGELRGVWETGAPDVLIVAADDGREHLVPAALLRDVDLEARRAVVEVLPGLIEDA